MLTFEEAKKIGIRACMDKIGYDFCMQHKDNAVSTYGEDDGIVYCFVGVSDQPEPDYDSLDYSELKLTHENDWTYYASCNVDRSNGAIEFLECKVPE